MSISIEIKNSKAYITRLLSFRFWILGFTLVKEKGSSDGVVDDGCSNQIDTLDLIKRIGKIHTQTHTVYVDIYS